MITLGIKTDEVALWCTFIHHFPTVLCWCSGKDVVNIMYQMQQRWKLSQQTINLDGELNDENIVSLSRLWAGL